MHQIETIAIDIYHILDEKNFRIALIESFYKNLLFSSYKKILQLILTYNILHQQF